MGADRCQARSGELAGGQGVGPDAQQLDKARGIEALQILGGAGYTTEHAVERYWRDAKLTTIFEGTSEIQRKIISDRVLGGSGVVT
jgi:alkylation response protein AidB-like acyl-CoA dehydrogenase